MTNRFVRSTNSYAGLQSINGQEYDNFATRWEAHLIRVIEGSRPTHSSKEVEAMFRNRAEIFFDRLGWDVSVKNGYERDEFDEQDPVYLISLDPDSGEYRGSLRLLPTIGRNMLRDVFPFLLRDDEIVESATIWEVSRICTLLSEAPERHRGGVSPAFAELLAGIGEIALLSGWTQMVAVFDTRVFRMLKAAGCNPQIIGKPTRIGKTMSFAGLFDTGVGPLQAIRDAMGIRGPVLEPRFAPPLLFEGPCVEPAALPRQERELEAA